MYRSKVDAGVPNQQFRNVEPTAVSPSGVLAIVLFFGAAMWAYSSKGARK